MSGKRCALGCSLVLVLGLFVVSGVQPQQGKSEPAPEPVKQPLQKLEESLKFAEESLKKSADELMLFHRLEDIAEVDKSRYTGPPPRVIKNPTAQGAGNPVVLSAYTFIPKKPFPGGKRPLIVLVHGGVHANFNSTFVHTLRELMGQGYAVVAPDYRGSTGYGKDLWHLIDYGGLEVEDVYAARQWMLDTHDDVDPAHVGIMGWSHGGLITLMNLFAHPKDYQVGYAGVPVSDIVARMGYKNQDYRDLFSAPYHIGKTAEEDVNEYRKRSPAWNAEKLQTPLLIHTTTNDEDVNVLEVEHLIKALKAANKKFEHKIYKDAPGGHEFNRIDTKLAKESRAEVYKFLAKFLKPE
ncbi:MAG TPA: alpha/beta fold hydrolase [Gemmataceae bacterium]|jgi:dipeptidyl aminopeptidase/acylaminoacyl peptidase|nr:alpha/beta fold hydrolase [Gemmataceae bacterium]